MVQPTLSSPIQNLMKRIFNINMLKKVIKHYELDEKSKKLFDKKLQKYRYHKHFYAFEDKQRSTSHLNNEEIFRVMFEMLLELLDSQPDNCNFNHRMYSLSENLLDICYNQLQSSIDVLSVDTDDFKVILKYIQNTHSRFHDHYTIKVENIFTVKENDDTKFMKNLDNIKLLWYGTEVHKVADILFQGFNGTRLNNRSFDEEICFTNIASKAANHCGTYGRNKNGVLLLCEVALGDVVECYTSDDRQQLPFGKHSIFGRGFLSPDQTLAEKFSRVEVPCGPLVEFFRRTDLRHDKFIVYNENQVRICYIVTVKFDYTSR